MSGKNLIHFLPSSLLEDLTTALLVHPLQRHSLHTLTRRHTHAEPPLLLHREGNQQIGKAPASLPSSL